MYVELAELVKTRRITYSEFREMWESGLIKNLFIPVGEWELQKVEDLKPLMQDVCDAKKATARDITRDYYAWLKEYWGKKMPEWQARHEQLKRRHRYDSPEKVFIMWREETIEKVKRIKKTDADYIDQVLRLRTAKTRAERVMRIADDEKALFSETAINLIIYRHEYEDAVKKILMARKKAKKA